MMKWVRNTVQGKRDLLEDDGGQVGLRVGYAVQAAKHVGEVPGIECAYAKANHV